MLQLSHLILLFLPTFVQAIIGGEEVSHPHKYPWIVGLYGGQSKTYNSIQYTYYTLKCGGSIISEDVILTAAHCVTDTSRILVKMGHSTINSEESIDMTVKSVLLHPDYEASKALNDIAT